MLVNKKTEVQKQSLDHVLTRFSLLLWGLLSLKSRNSKKQGAGKKSTYISKTIRTLSRQNWERIKRVCLFSPLIVRAFLPICSIPLTGLFFNSLSQVHLWLLMSTWNKRLSSSFRKITSYVVEGPLPVPHV